MPAWVVIYRRHLRDSTSISSSLRARRLWVKFSDSLLPSFSFASHLPYLLPSSVSCKSFGCRSYKKCRVLLALSSFFSLFEQRVTHKSCAVKRLRTLSKNNWGVYQQFPFWNFRISRRFDVQTFRRFNVAMLPHPPKSLPFNLFADPHPLNLYAPIFCKNSGGRGCPPYSSRATVHGSRSTERATSSCISTRSGIHVSQLTPTWNSGMEDK